MPFVNQSATGSLQTWPRRSAAPQTETSRPICCATPSWVRRVRRGIANGWERDYDCKGFGGRVGLRVHTDAADRYIKYVTFRVDGKLIGGGVVNVPSVLVGQASLMGRKIQNASFAATEATPRFRPFTASELAKLTTELEYGDGGIIDSMFEERV